MAYHIQFPAGDDVSLPRVLLTEYIPQAPAAYVSVLLYAWGRFGQGELEPTAIAAALNQSTSAVETALLYWKEQGFLVQKLTKERPSYAPQELSLYIERSPQVRNLFLEAERVLARPISHTDMEILFSFYDCLHLPMEVIDCLLQYCEARNGRSLNYIEKVALSWAEEGINTPEAAAAHCEKFLGGYREVMKAFGIKNRELNPTETDYIKKWRQEWAMPLPLIALACEKTILQGAKQPFSYADKILSNWKQSGVKTIEDVSALDAARKRKSAVKKPTEAPKANRFVNFDQRDLDFEAMAAKKRQALATRKEG